MNNIFLTHLSEGFEKTKNIFQTLSLYSITPIGLSWLAVKFTQGSPVPTDKIIGLATVPVAILVTSITLPVSLIAGTAIILIGSPSYALYRSFTQDKTNEHTPPAVIASDTAPNSPPLGQSSSSSIQPKLLADYQAHTSPSEDISKIYKCG